MVRKKRRVYQHVMEDESYEIIKSQIPKEWVIREFNRPDYGIDLVIELFEKIDDKIAETLGEFIYVQVKAMKTLDIKTETIYDVGNVAKGVWVENKERHVDIEVVKYSYDTNSIFTIQSLGASVSVLLFLVDISTKEVYFVCMNDYIDKIILPKHPEYTNQDNLTISVPALNKLSSQEISSNALRFYGKRAKFLAAFSKFSYQKNEIGYLLQHKDFPVWTYRDEIQKGQVYKAEEIKIQLLYFISQIEELDVWDHKEWQVLPEAKKELLAMKNLLQQEINWEEARNKIIILWHQLTNLGTMYEDICREWFLPKIIGLLTSYPIVPDIVDESEKG